MTKSRKLPWRGDREIFGAIRRELFTAVVGDVMDKLGFQRQFLPPEIQPLRPDMVVVGRAMTVLEADVFAEDHPESRNPLLKKPFGLMLEAVDDLKTDEVYVCAGASPTYALWGELMSVRANKLGAAGAVMDGFSRDTHGILALNFPLFGRGRYAQDQAPRGKVIDFRVPVEIGSVRIEPGDIIFGDIDGVCVVPRKIEVEVMVGALEKVSGEKRVREALIGGMSAREAFEKYHVM